MLKGNVLERLASLYTDIERHDALILQKRLSAVASVERALEREHAAARRILSTEERKIVNEDSLQRALAGVESEMAGQRRRTLAKMMKEREEEAELARRKHIASRVKLEQASELLESAQRHARIEEERKLQILTDDRFLSRGRWVATQARSGE